MRAIIISLCLFIPACAHAGAADTLRRGNHAYKKEKYGAAYDLYQKAAAQGAREKGLYNTGAALYKLKDYPAAAETYQTLTEDKTAPLTQKAVYNLGNAYAQQGETDKAKAAFREAILLNPKDKAAVHNLQYLLEEKKKEEENQQRQQNQNNEQQEEQDKQNEQNQSEQSQNQRLSQDEADNILQMLKDQARKQQKTQAAQTADMQVEKDW
jgi:tetratricopeptide (TPR) repeat protein